MTEASFRIPLLVGVGIAVFANAWFIFLWKPKLAMATWAAILFLVPVWVGVQAGAFYSAITLVSILLVAASSLRAFRLSVVDALMVSFTVLLIVGWALGWIQWGHLLIAVLQWMVPFMAGRLAPSRVGLRWIYSCLATGTVVAACLAIGEFLSGFNPFVLIKANNSLYDSWHALQFRGGELRVEGAFGHSIALGAALAMCSVFVLVVAWPQWLRLLSLLAVSVAVALTFSRIGLVVLALTVVLALVALPRDLRPSFRWKAGLLAAAAGAGAIPLLLDVFSTAGSEATDSAAYRTELLALLGGASPLGLAKSWAMTTSGVTYFGAFQSIDSEFVLTAMRFGMVPLLLLVAAMACCVVTVLGNRATPAAVAVLGMLPAFAAVAMITQFAALAWFIAGLAVASYQQAGRPAVPGRLALAQPSEAMLPNGKEVRWLR